MKHILFVSMLASICSFVHVDVAAMYREHASPSQTTRIMEPQKQRTKQQYVERQSPPKDKRPKDHHKARKAMDIIKRHQEFIATIKDRTTSIIALLKKYNMSVGNLPAILEKLDQEQAMLTGLKQQIKEKQITRETIKSTLKKQRSDMKLIMKELRSELLTIVSALKK